MLAQILTQIFKAYYWVQCEIVVAKALASADYNLAPEGTWFCGHAYDDHMAEEDCPDDVYLGGAIDTSLFDDLDDESDED